MDLFGMKKKQSTFQTAMNQIVDHAKAAADALVSLEMTKVVLLGVTAIATTVIACQNASKK